MLHGPIRTQRRAKKLRRSLTLPEVLLWQVLRTRPDGLRFRRQHPAGRYVLDFYCPARRLAVEVDGEAHDHGGRPDHDANRDAWLGQQGVTVCRIPAKDLLSDLDAAVRLIIGVALGLPLHQPAAGPPPLAGEELVSVPIA